MTACTMNDFTLTKYERKYAGGVKECALRAWHFTYGKIFSSSQIAEYVDRFYSEENNLAAEDLIARDLLRYSVARDHEGNVLGFQSSSINMLCAELTRIYVIPEKIGTGLGTALLKDSESFFRITGFKSYQVKVHKYNTIGQKFYERKGFSFVAEDNADHLLLKKHLH